MHKRPVVAKTLARELGETASQRIWRSVVFAGAMLGTAGCGGGSKPAEEPTPTPVNNVADPVTPDPMATDATAPDPAAQASNPCATPSANPCAATVTADPANPCGAATTDPAANPCAVEPEPATQGKRVRGRKSRKTGRGFILS